MKIKDKNIFFCSDPHFNHKNICEGVTEWGKGGSATRPFQTLEEMNSKLIDSINRKVGADDYLFCLGDWAFGGVDSIFTFRDNIKCNNIILTYGNHDHHIINNKYPLNQDSSTQELFNLTDYYIELETKYHNFVMSHYPIVTWNNMRRGAIHLFGHVHLSPEDKIREGKAMDVGFDGNENFEPYSLDEVVELMSKQPIRNISIPQEKDHH